MDKENAACIVDKRNAYKYWSKNVNGKYNLRDLDVNWCMKKGINENMLGRAWIGFN